MDLSTLLKESYNIDPKEEYSLEDSEVYATEMKLSEQEYEEKRAWLREVRRKLGDNSK